MPERGARPNVPARRRAVLRVARAITSPLLPDDYLELINPLWSSRELRGRVERIERETDGARTVVIRPGWGFGGHEPGQYIRVGFDVGGVRHWRAYSLTSLPGDDEGAISITVKGVDGGRVSSYVTRELRPGTIVTLGEVAGEFTLPQPLPDKLLFVSAGSGVTPVMSLLRALDHRGALGDAMHIHSAKDRGDVIFGAQLRDVERRNGGFRLHERHTSVMDRFAPVDLDDLCPDWAQREAFISGPADLLDALCAHWEQRGDPARLHLERFQPTYGEGGDGGAGGSISFLGSSTAAVARGGMSILVAGEHAGLELPYGCRMGICHTCVGRLCSGRVRDLRNGVVRDSSGETIRTCIHAPEGDIEIEL